MTKDIDNIRRFRGRYGDGVNWGRAEHGWVRYHDDGFVTLDPKVFFRKKVKEVQNE